MRCYAEHVFFSQSDDEPPVLPYDYRYSLNRAHAEFGRPNFMSSR